MSISTYIQANTTSVDFLINALAEMSQENYDFIAKPAFQSSIGAHYRHIIEHYQCFFLQFDVDEVINYDARQRNIKIETDIEFALQQLRLIHNRLTGFRCDDKREILIADDHCDYQMRSSLSRELMFLIGHTEHHSAMIAAMLRMSGCGVDEQFGVANATINHQHSIVTERSA